MAGRWVGGVVLGACVLSACVLPACGSSSGGGGSSPGNGGSASDGSSGAGAGTGGASNAGASSGGSSTNGGSGAGGGISTTDLDATCHQRSTNHIAGARIGHRYVDWWDSELQIQCELTPMADGSYRCMPEEGGSQPGRSLKGFSDAGCTQPVDMWRVPTCLLPSMPKYLVVRDYAQRCERPITSLRQLGTAHASADFPVWVGSPASCTLHDGADASYVELGPELDPSIFMSATLETP